MAHIYRPLWRPLWRSFVVAGIIMGGLFSGHTRTTTTAFAANDPNTLIVANDANATSLDPAIGYDGTGPAVFRNVYEPLVHLKGSTSQIEGVLATSWTANAAKTVWTFNLRQGVMFHDGTPFNANAVKFSISRTVTINSGPAYIIGQYVDPKNITIISPYKVQFALKIPGPGLLTAMASQWGNWIVSPTTIEQHNVKGDLGQAWLANHDAGSGPYILQNYTPNASITLVKYPNYWRGWAGKHVNRVIISFVSQEATRRELIEKGDADITLDFVPQNLLALQKEAQVKVDTTPLILDFLLTPTESGPFASAKARQALAYAFDYDALNKSYWKGFAVQAQGPLHHLVVGHNNKLAMYHTDLAKAKQLFAEAGVKPGTVLTMWYTDGQSFAKPIALIAQAQLAQLGITVKLSQRDIGTYINAQGGDEPASQRPNLWVNNWFPDYNDPIAVLKPIYHTRQNGLGTYNCGLYSNKEADALMAQASVEANPAKRQAMIDRLQQILTWDDPAQVYISDATNYMVYRSSLKGYYFNPAYNGSFDFYPMSKS